MPLKKRMPCSTSLMFGNNTRECWIPTQKDNPHLRAKEKPQQDSRRGEITFRIKHNTCQRHSDGSNKPCAQQEPETPQTEPELYLSVFESPAEVRVSSGLLQGQGLWVQQTWAWHKFSWRRSPLTPPECHQNWHSTGETNSWRAQTKPCAHRDPGKKQWPRKRLTQTCPWVSRSLWQRRGSMVACCRTGDTQCSSAYMGPSEGACSYLHYLHHSLASGQTTWREHSSTHQKKTGLKIYWAWPHYKNKTQFPHQSASPIRKLP